MAEQTLTMISAHFAKLDLEDFLGNMESYLEFVAGGTSVKTSIAKGQGKDPEWEDTLTFPPATSKQIKLRALSQKDLQPDKLLGEATVQLSAISSGTASTVTLLGKDGVTPAGEVTFTLSGGETAAAEHATVTATAATGGDAGDHDPCAQAATAGYSGGGATAYPAVTAHKDLGGEHLHELDPAVSSPVEATAGFGGSGATVFPALSKGKDLGGERLHDFAHSHAKGSKVTKGPFPSEGQQTAEHGTGLGLSEGAVTAAMGGDAGDHDPCAQAATAGYSGGGATAYPAVAAHKDLGGEHLHELDPAVSSPVEATAGFGGSGATAFPALSKGKDLGGEHLHDFAHSHAKGSKVTKGPFPSEGQQTAEHGTGL